MVVHGLLLKCLLILCWLFHPAELSLPQLSISMVSLTENLLSLTHRYETSKPGLWNSPTLLFIQGSYVFTKQSPSDQLRQLLLQTGPDSEEVRSYFVLHKEQACATCLVLACNQNVTERQASELATRAFFMHGGEPEHNYAGGPSSIGPGNQFGLLSPSSGTVALCLLEVSLFIVLASFLLSDFQPRQMSTPFHNVTQQLHFPSSPYGAAQQNSDVVYSHRLRGMCIYLARLLRYSILMFCGTIISHYIEGPCGIL
jgi:hypothetical protein